MSSTASGGGCITHSDSGNSLPDRQSKSKYRRQLVKNTENDTPKISSPDKAKLKLQNRPILEQLPTIECG